MAELFRYNPTPTIGIGLTESENIGSIPEFPKIAIPISDMDRPKYLEHLHQLSCWQLHLNGWVPQKLMAQSLLQHEGLGDKNTILVAANDIAGQKHIIQGYIQAGKVPIWSGSSIRNDMADQAAPTKGREHAGFWRGIYTLNDWLKLLPKISPIIKQHPELLFKIFPQDKPYSISRLLTTTNGLIVQTKFDQLNGRDELKQKNKLITVSIEENPYTHKYKCVSDEPESALVIASLSTRKALRYFRTLQESLWRLPSLKINILNPEFMLDLTNPEIAFFTDLVYGTDPRFPHTPLPDIAKLLEAASLVKIEHTSDFLNKHPNE